MKICTKLVTYDAGDHSLAESIADFESDGRVWVAVTGTIDPVSRLPFVRLVGEPEAVLTALQDGWDLSYDEVLDLLEG